MRLFMFLSLIVASLAPPWCAARDVAVITDKANAASALSSAELLKLFKAGTPNWPDGKKVTVYLSSLGSEDSRLVLDRIYKMTPAEIRAFVEAHKGAVAVLPSDELVMKAVAEHPGAIGVVNVYSLNSAVKVLKVDGKFPLERGYLLHGN